MNSEFATSFFRKVEETAPSKEWANVLRQHIQSFEKKPAMTYPVFSFSHLEHAEFLTTRTQHDQAFHFVVYFLGFGRRMFLFPVWPESSDEFLPVDETGTVMIEHVSHGVHFQFTRVEFYATKWKSKRALEKINKRLSHSNKAGKIRVVNM